MFVAATHGSFVDPQTHPTLSTLSPRMTMAWNCSPSHRTATCRSQELPGPAENKEEAVSSQKHASSTKRGQEVPQKGGNPTCSWSHAGNIDTPEASELPGHTSPGARDPSRCAMPKGLRFV